MYILLVLISSLDTYTSITYSYVVLEHTLFPAKLCHFILFLPEFNMLATIILVTDSILETLFILVDICSNTFSTLTPLFHFLLYKKVYIIKAPVSFFIPQKYNIMKTRNGLFIKARRN